MNRIKNLNKTGIDFNQLNKVIAKVFKEWDNSVENKNKSDWQNFVSFIDNSEDLYIRDSYWDYVYQSFVNKYGGFNEQIKTPRNQDDFEEQEAVNREMYGIKKQSDSRVIADAKLQGWMDKYTIQADEQVRQILKSNLSRDEKDVKITERVKEMLLEMDNSEYDIVNVINQDVEVDWKDIMYILDDNEEELRNTSSTRIKTGKLEVLDLKRLLRQKFPVLETIEIIQNGNGYDITLIAPQNSIIDDDDIEYEIWNYFDKYGDMANANEGIQIIVSIKYGAPWILNAKVPLDGTGIKLQDSLESQSSLKISTQELKEMIEKNNNEYGTTFKILGAYGQYELWDEAGGNRIETGSRKDIYDAFVKVRFKEKYRNNIKLKRNMKTKVALTFKKDFGYWDVTKYPKGGDFKRFKGNEEGEIINDDKYKIESADEIVVKLNDGRIIVTKEDSINEDYDNRVESLLNTENQIKNNKSSMKKKKAEVNEVDFDNKFEWLRAVREIANSKGGNFTITNDDESNSEIAYMEGDEWDYISAEIGYWDRGANYGEITTSTIKKSRGGNTMYNEWKTNKENPSKEILNKIKQAIINDGAVAINWLKGFTGNDEDAKMINNQLDRLSIKISNHLGQDESFDLEPEFLVSLDHDEINEEFEETEKSNNIINTQQSKEVIENQLAVEVNNNYPQELTFDSIFQCACDTGLCDNMERYDLIGVLNNVAIEFGLPRISWDEYFPNTDIVDELDLNGTDSSISYDEDVEFDADEIINEYDNDADDLFVIDRILDERLKHFIDTDKLIIESAKVVKDSLNNLKRKQVYPKQYRLGNMYIKDIDGSGRIINGEISYTIKLKSMKDRNIEKDINITLPIRARTVERPLNFQFKNETYPLENYYISSVIEQ